MFLLPRAFEAADYRHFPVIGSRVIVWALAQSHLMFAAFVLGVPIFVLIAEVMGVALKSERYDGLAKEFTRLLAMSYTITATLGGLLLVRGRLEAGAFSLLENLQDFPANKGVRVFQRRDQVFVG